MDCKLVVMDWHRVGIGSVYNSELGVQLSSGDLHSGTTFSAVVSLPEDIQQEIKEAYKTHQSYPVFALVPNVEH